MSQHKSSDNKRRYAAGFTMLEVVVAISILTIGLVSMAFMMSSMTLLGTQARYVNMANVLASEKLDSLNKFPSTDPNVACATTCGSLTGSLTCASGDIYCDTVDVSESSGADYETQTQINNGVATTTTIVHTAAGCVDTPANCGVASPPSGSTFTRRWLITASPTVSTNGALTTVTSARRITVIVSRMAAEKAGVP